MPQRIQRKRTAGWRKPEGAVIVSRPSRWGNPFRIDRSKLGIFVLRDDGSLLVECESVEEARQIAAGEFALHIGPMGAYEYDEAALADLRRELGGRDLVCWCPLPEPGEPDHCHAAVLLELANRAEAGR